MKKRSVKMPEDLVSVLPCPHGCQGKPKVYMDAPGKGHARWLHVACLECGSGSPTVEIWNRRYVTV